jgi:hypothetical protein
MTATTRWIPFLLLFAGCQQGRPPEPIALNAELRLLGVNAADYGAVLVEVKDLVVTAGARRLTVTPGQTRIDLSNPSQAWLVGKVAIPVGVDRVHVSLQLDDFGGYQSATAAGAIDARSAPIEFDAPVAWMTQHKSATVRLDVSRSLTAFRADTRVLLPQASLAY